MALKARFPLLIMVAALAAGCAAPDSDNSAGLHPQDTDTLTIPGCSDNKAQNNMYPGEVPLDDNVAPDAKIRQSIGDVCDSLWKEPDLDAGVGHIIYACGIYHSAYEKQEVDAGINKDPNIRRRAVFAKHAPRLEFSDDLIGVTSRCRAGWGHTLLVDADQNGNILNIFSKKEDLIHVNRINSIVGAAHMIAFKNLLGTSITDRVSVCEAKPESMTDGWIFSSIPFACHTLEHDIFVTHSGTIGITKSRMRKYIGACAVE